MQNNGNEFFDDSSQFLNNLKKGKAFLITKREEKVNVMQIGWGYIGYMWKKPSIIIAVRHSRFTCDILKDTDEFSICIPKDNDYIEQLKICGTYSGRDIDKLEVCKFEMIESKSLKVPLIKDSQYNYECKIIYKQSLDPVLMDKSILESSYKNNDYHLMIYGEIISSH